MLENVLITIPLDIVCLMETCVFLKNRALVNVQKLAFCGQLNAEENIYYLVLLSGHVDMC